MIGSLREHWLNVLTAQRKLDRAAKQVNPDKTGRLFVKEDLQDERRREQAKFDDALEELNRIDVYLLDAVKGLAMIPFRKEDDLAWFVFDQFAVRGLIGWRYHHDPIEECRPLSLLQEPVASDPVSN